MTLTATIEDAGKRLDAFVAEKAQGVSRSAAARLIAQGSVTVNGKAADKHFRLSEADNVQVTIPEAADTAVTAQDIPLDVVYEDEDVIVVNKPVGMVVHPAPGHAEGTLVNALLHHCGDSLSGIGGEKRPGIVHRIDRDTSGLIIAAKNDAAHLALSAQLADHTLARTYECIVTGTLREDSGTVDAPIARHPRDRKKMAVVAGGKRAVTHWEVLGRYRGATHVRCRLETGRTHQIRVHMAHLGYPLVGDFLYGTERRDVIARPALHSFRLEFLHPVTEREMRFEIPVPEDMERLI